jgi:hypothetical protein
VSEFSWWMLIVGLVVGAGLVWLVLADGARRDAEIEARELPAEAAWIADAMADQGRPIDPSDAEEVLRLHRAYLASPPPDDDDLAPLARDAGPADGTGAADERGADRPTDASSPSQAPREEAAT